MVRTAMVYLTTALLVGCAAESTTPTSTPAIGKEAVHPQFQAKLSWLVDYDTALKAARDQHKVLLMDFTGSDWCSWCQRLDAEVFSTDTFKAWADTHAVLLKVDFPQRQAQPDAEKKQNAELAQRFGIDGFPTIVLADATGTALGKLGYLQGGAEDWIEQAQRILKSSQP